MITVKLANYYLKGTMNPHDIRTGWFPEANSIMIKRSCKNCFTIEL